MSLDEALALGFDNSKMIGKHLFIGCSQCNAIIIQGTPCHESKACPNEKHECYECEALIDKGMLYCESCAESF